MGKEINKFTVAGNYEYKETENINSAQSSLKSHSLWITLYEMYVLGSEFSLLCRTAVDASYVYILYIYINHIYSLI